MAKKSGKSKKIIWRKMPIPNNAILYKYVHHSQIKNNTPSEKQFKEFNLSVDWSKYTTPEQTRASLAEQRKANGVFKIPADYFILQFSVTEVLLTVPTQRVEHDPIQNDPILTDNRAHSLIIGEKDEEVRLKFVDMVSDNHWAISPPINFTF